MGDSSRSRFPSSFQLHTETPPSTSLYGVLAVRIDLPLSLSLINSRSPIPYQFVCTVFTPRRYDLVVFAFELLLMLLSYMFITQIYTHTRQMTMMMIGVVYYFGICTIAWRFVLYFCIQPCSLGKFVGYWLMRRNLMNEIYTCVCICSQSWSYTFVIWCGSSMYVCMYSVCTPYVCMCLHSGAPVQESENTGKIALQLSNHSSLISIDQSTKPNQTRPDQTLD